MHLLVVVLFYFLHLHCTNLAGKSEQVDEAFCIVVVIQIAGCEGSKAFIVERVRRSCAGFDDIALVELEFYFAGYIFLSLFYECLNCLAQRSEPFAFVYNLSHLVAHIDLFCIGIAVEDQLFQLLMCLHQDRSAGSLINAAGFHADNTVLYDIYDADAIFNAEGRTRLPLVLMMAIDITVYHLFCIHNPQKLSDVRKDRYDRAVEWLKQVAKQQISIDGAPLLPDEDRKKNSPWLMYSNPKRHNHL